MTTVDDLVPDDYDVRHADSLLARTIGWMGRRDIDGEALVFQFDDVRERAIHMVGVLTPLRVVWLREETVVRDEVLRPFIGHASAPADTVIELPVSSDK